MRQNAFSCEASWLYWYSRTALVDDVWTRGVFAPGNIAFRRSLHRLFKYQTGASRVEGAED